MTCPVNQYLFQDAELGDDLKQDLCHTLFRNGMQWNCFGTTANTKQYTYELVKWASEFHANVLKQDLRY